MKLSNTPNINLTKPDFSNWADVRVLNDNFDKIDTAFEKATQAEAEAGADSNKIMTPLTTKQAILKLSPQLEYKDVTNLSATTAGVITWQLPLATDQTRTAIMLCRATKDISNTDYATCLSDSSVTKNTLGKDITTNTYTGLTNNTQYWVKAFVKYTLGGKEFYSNGVTVTFTYNVVPPIIDYYNAGNEFASVTGGWVQGYKVGTDDIIQKNSDNIYVQIKGNPGKNYVETSNPIDLTSRKKLKISWQFVDEQGTLANYIRNFGLHNVKSSDLYTSYVSINQSTTPGTNVITSEIDVQNITGSYYLKFSAYSAFTDTISKVRVYRVWGES